MSVPRGLLVGLLLALRSSVEGAGGPQARGVSGAVGQDVVLTLHGFQLSGGDVDEVRWEKGGALVARRRGERTTRQRPAYEVLPDGSLRIRGLEPGDGAAYHVLLYNLNGTQVFHGAVHLTVLEMVSKPIISWNCSNATLTCKLLRGTDAQLKLCQKQNCHYTDTQLIRYTWAKLDAPFNCTARNGVSEQATETTVHCPATDRALYICLVAGVCGGGLALACVGLLVFHVNKKRKQRSRRNDEELEIGERRTASRERQPGPCPLSTPPRSPGASRPPPPPAPRLQAPSYRPPPPSHRVQHQQQKRPRPAGLQAPQQRGPPLPRPRGHPEPPPRATQGSLAAPSL
ncbi:T-cell surface antigen CD2 [Thomomys bottae]